MAVVPVAFVALVAAHAEAPILGQQLAPVWVGVRDIAVHCRGGAAERCERVLELVSSKAPYPVTVLTDQTFQKTLIIHAIFESDDGRTTLTLSAERVVAFDDAQGSLLPRSFIGGEHEADDVFIARALDQFLPWRRLLRPSQTLALPTGRLS